METSRGHACQGFLRLDYLLFIEYNKTPLPYVISINDEY